MATVENVNIEINQKLLDELAALKAEYQKLYGNYANHDRWVNELKAENEQLAEAYRDMGETMFKVNEENERLKELYTTYVLQCEKLAAEKAELLDALRMAYNLTSFKSPDEDNHLLYILSKHEAK